MAASLKGSSTDLMGIVVVGFHHSKGSVVEFVYPEEFVVSEFNYLVHQALPDGAHNVNSGTVCFCVRHHAKSNDTAQSVQADSIRFAVSCFRQICTDELTTVESEATRSTVQKAVCVISQTPMYGVVAAKLAVVTEAYFNTRDLGNRSVLVDLYQYLIKSLDQGPSAELQYLGLDVGRLFSQLRHKPLQIVKALLLGQTVMLYSPSAECASKAVLSVTSLIPSLLSRIVQPGDDARQNSKFWMVEPYVCLQQMALVQSLYASKRLHLYGTANPLFESRSADLCDVCVNLCSGQLTINKESCKPLLSLTLADLRFIDSLLTDGQKRTSHSNSELDTVNTWEGSDDNIRRQFKRYIQSLFTVCQSDDTHVQGDFNQDFVDTFIKSSVLSCLSDNPLFLGLDGREGMVDSQHPSHSSFSMKDIGLSLDAQVRDLVTKDQMDKVKRLASSTSDHLAGAWASVVSWWNSPPGEANSTTSTDD